MERIAQMVIVPVVQARFRRVDDFDASRARRGRLRLHRQAAERLSARGVPGGAVFSTVMPSRAQAARLDLLLAGFAHVVHLQLQAQRHAGQRMVAVQHHVRRVDLGHDVEHVGRHVGRDAAARQALEVHAGFQLLGEQLARLEAHQFAAVVAEGVLGLQVQVHLVAGLVAGQRFLHLGQQVVAAEEELDRLGQFVDPWPCASDSVQVRVTTQGPVIFIAA